MAAVLALVAAPLVLAAPPTAADFRIEPPSPEVDEPVTFTFESVSDVDNDGSAGGIQWDFDYTGSFTEDATGPSATTSYPSAGPRTVAMRVTDGLVDDGTADAILVTEAVNVEPPPPPANQPPVASFTISPNPAPVNRDVTFDGSASSDPDGPEPFAETNYDWDLDGDGSFETSGRVVTRRYETPGTRTIRLQVTDQNGTPSAVAERTLTVNNSAPTNVDFTWRPEGKPVGAAADLGKPVAFSASATDPEGQSLTYTWDFGDGTPPVTGQNATHTFTSAGDKSVRLTVSDPHASAPVRTKTVTVNRPPTAAFTVATVKPLAGQRPDRPLLAQAPFEVTCAVGAERSGECVEFTSTSTDPDGTIARLDWDLDGDPATGVDGFEVSTTDRTVRSSYPIPGNRSVRLRVTDNSGASSQPASVNIRVNRSPAIPAGTPGFIFVSPTPVIDEPVRFISQIEDPDNDIAKYEWDLDGNGTTGADGFEVDAGGSASYTHTFTTSGIRTVRLRATDEGGISVIVARQVRVQASRPTGDFSFTPTAPVPGQEVTFVSVAGTSGPGKEILKREWDFDWNGGDFTVDASGDSARRSFATSGPKSVALRITEGPPGSSPDTQGELIVVRTVDVNAPPRASFSVAPENAFVGDTVTLSSSSADPDGPLARQEWDLDNDGQFDDATGAVVSRTFPKPGTYPLKLRVTDARGATATAEGRVTVRRRPTPLLTGVDVGLRALVFPKHTKVRWLRVRAPVGSKVTVRCRGKRCPKRAVKTSRGTRRMVLLRAVKTSKGSRKRMRFKTFERRFRPKTKLVVTVTKSGFIGRQTTFTIRRGKGPVRRDLCLPPGAKKASPCPEQ